jgi:hypothetical protein
MRTIKQGTLLFPRSAIQFKSESNRLVTLHPAQSVWVCNSQVDQQLTGIVKIARSGRSSGYAWNFSIADAIAYFNCPPESVVANNATTDHGQAVENAMLAKHPNVI